MFSDEDGGLKKKKKDEVDLDITPMIDVVFLLLIFFMVTSTMKPAPSADIPPTETGDTMVVAGTTTIFVMAPSVPGGDAKFELEDRPATLDEIRDYVGLAVAQQKPGVIIMADRDVPSGLLGELEIALSEIEGVQYNFAVRDQK